MELLIWSSEVPRAGMDIFFLAEHISLSYLSGHTELIRLVFPTSGPVSMLCKCCKLLSANLSLADRKSVV